MIKIKDNTLIVAFDGMDYTQVQELDNLDNIKSMKEIGSIDNTTGMKTIKTSELFTSFITGENYKEHGVTGLYRWNNPSIGKIINFLTGTDKYRDRFPGLYRLYNALQELTKVYHYGYDKETLEVASIFDEISDSKALFVPGWNPSITWKFQLALRPVVYGVVGDELNQYWDREHYYRRRKLFEELDNHERDLLMVHFHQPDFSHHAYGMQEGDIVQSVISTQYERLDKLLGRILENAEQYDRVIMMSDHGLPTKQGHNENAFYATNKELFPSKTPKITDFKQKVV